MSRVRAAICTARDQASIAVLWMNREKGQSTEKDVVIHQIIARIEGANSMGTQQVLDNPNTELQEEAEFL